MRTKSNSRDTERIFSIREASEITGVPAYTIRFWEKDFGMFLNPVRTRGGQRRYTSEDIELIGKIKHYRYKERHTIPGVINELSNGKKRLRTDAFEQMVDEIAEMIKDKVLKKMEENV